MILLYLESITHAERFRNAAFRVGRQKPIVAIKSGRDQAGQRAARSHIAALTSSDVAIDALLRQTGIVRAEGLDEMLDLAALFTHQPLPLGRRVGIVTNAGGLAVLCADACAEAGLDVPILFVQAHDDEVEAFEHFALSNPDNIVLLIDTYDTEAAAEKSIDLAARLTEKGITVKGVRLDSGDLAEHAHRVRRILDEGGLTNVTIFASGNQTECLTICIHVRDSTSVSALQETQRGLRWT